MISNNGGRQGERMENLRAPLASPHQEVDQPTSMGRQHQSGEQLVHQHNKTSTNWLHEI